MVSQRVIAEGKEIIKDHIRSSSIGATVRIPVHDEANLTVFTEIARSADIQRMASQKHVLLEFYIVDTIGQLKSHMLAVITNASSQIREIVFPYLQPDYELMVQALQSSEVQALLTRRKITASLRLVGKDGKPCPDIVIATYKDAHNGNLKRFLDNFEHD